MNVVLLEGLPFISWPFRLALRARFGYNVLGRDRGIDWATLARGCESAMIDINEIRTKVRADQYAYTQHAEIERRSDELTFAQIEEALLNGEILEQYPDTGRGESCLIVGFADDVPLHVVCGWRGDKIVLITVYVPRPPRFVDPWTRGERADEPSAM